MPYETSAVSKKLGNLRGYRGTKLDFLEKKINTLQRKVNRNEPELKCYQITGNGVSTLNNTLNAVHLTGIAQGDDSNTRDGRKISIKGFDFRGNCDRNLDVYLVKSLDGVTPVYLDFFPIRGSHIVDERHFQLRIVAYIKSMASNTTFWTYKRRFAIPQYTHYDGAGAGNVIQNGWYLVLKNNSGGTINADYALNIWYTDA